MCVMISSQGLCGCHVSSTDHLLHEPAVMPAEAQEYNMPNTHTHTHTHTHINTADSNYNPTLLQTQKQNPWHQTNVCLIVFTCSVFQILKVHKKYNKFNCTEIKGNLSVLKHCIKFKVATLMYIYNNSSFLFFTLLFSHLADAFIQSDLLK